MTTVSHFHRAEIGRMAASARSHRPDHQLGDHGRRRDAVAVAFDSRRPPWRADLRHAPDLTFGYGSRPGATASSTSIARGARQFERHYFAQIFSPREDHSANWLAIVGESPRGHLSSRISYRAAFARRCAPQLHPYVRDPADRLGAEDFDAEPAERDAWRRRPGAYRIRGREQRAHSGRCPDGLSWRR